MVERLKGSTFWALEIARNMNISSFFFKPPSVKTTAWQYSYAVPVGGRGGVDGFPCVVSRFPCVLGLRYYRYITPGDIDGCFRAPNVYHRGCLMHRGVSCTAAYGSTPRVSYRD